MHGKRFFNQGTVGGGKAFSIGILLLTISLVLANIYLFLRSRDAPSVEEPSGGLEAVGDKNLKVGDSEWEVYKDDLYGYSVSFPPVLQPRTIESESYLSFIIFFIPEGIAGSGFGISVRENSLDEEVELIKGEIGVDIGANLVAEEEITKGGYLGKRLEYEPENQKEREPRTIMILNNGK
ncbi:hypothetical protein IID22_00065, partial [Patescibacteria group bacterium]|nr:hypothetical protein [Patescibacteria group bacterium]